MGRAGVKGIPQANGWHVPPLMSALSLSLQPLVGGAMKSLQACSSTRQDAQQDAIVEDGDIRAWGVVI